MQHSNIMYTIPYRYKVLVLKSLKFLINKSYYIIPTVMRRKQKKINFNMYHYKYNLNLMKSYRNPLKKYLINQIKIECRDLNLYENGST